MKLVGVLTKNQMRSQRRKEFEVTEPLFDIGYVKVVRIMHYSSPGAGEETRNLEEITRGRIKWDLLPTHVASDGHKIVSKNTWNGKKRTRQCDTANDGSGKLHQNGMR